MAYDSVAHRGSHESTDNFKKPKLRPSVVRVLRETQVLYLCIFIYIYLPQSSSTELSGTV